MKKLLIIAMAAALAGCATKSRSFDAKGLYVSESGQLAIGRIHVDAIPEGTDSAVVHYSEDTAWIHDTKIHAIDIILTGSNSVTSARGIVKSITDAFVAVAPSVPHEAQKSSAIDLAKSNSDNAKAKKLAKIEAGKTQAASTACSDGSCSPCEDGACSPGQATSD